MTAELPVNLVDATPRRLLVDWANSQDAWVRQLTAETIRSRQTPRNQFIDTVYETFLVEKSLAAGDSPDAPKLEVAAVSATEDEVLREAP